MTYMRPPEENPQPLCGYCYHPDCAECNPYSAPKTSSNPERTEAEWLRHARVLEHENKVLKKALEGRDEIIKTQAEQIFRLEEELQKERE